MLMARLTGSKLDVSALEKRLGDSANRSYTDEHGAIGDTTGRSILSVSDRERAGVLRITGHDHGGGRDGCAGCGDLHPVATLEAQPLSQCRPHHQGVVPGQLRDRIGQFLHPADVSEATVEDLAIMMKHQFDVVGSATAGHGVLDGRGHDVGGDGASILERPGGIGLEAVGQGIPPLSFEGEFAGFVALLGRLPNDLETVNGIFAGHHRGQLERTAAAL